MYLYVICKSLQMFESGIVYIQMLYAIAQIENLCLTN